MLSYTPLKITNTPRPPQTNMLKADSLEQRGTESAIRRAVVASMNQGSRRRHTRYSLSHPQLVSLRVLRAPSRQTGGKFSRGALFFFVSSQGVCCLFGFLGASILATTTHTVDSAPAAGCAILSTGKLPLSDPPKFLLEASPKRTRPWLGGRSSPSLLLWPPWLRGRPQIASTLCL